MKFLSFKVGNEEKLGILSRDEKVVLELSSIKLSKKFNDMNDLIKNITEADIDKIKSILKNSKIEDYILHSLNEIKICTPIKKTIHDIICVGVNYQDHLDETKENFDSSSFKEPTKTVYFSKRVYETIGQDDEVISHSSIDKQLDYEVELAVVIGKKGINIPKEGVEDYIFGYTIMNDISARKLQKEHVQWYRGKSLDTFTALGPVIVHKSELPFPLKLNVCSKVNGELRQDSNTKYFIADVASIISEFSKGITLEPGDIIATGTPSGVGMGFTPSRFMKPGDIVECEVEKIGVLRNVIK